VNNLLESTYYREDQQALADLRQRFEACAEENPEFILKLAVHAREEMYLRDVSQVLLTLAAEDDRTKRFVRDYATDVMQRADEPATVVAIYDALFGLGTLPKPLKKGITDALHEFDEYQFGKYLNERREFGLRDVVNLVHPKPRDEEHADLFERLIRGPLDDYPDVAPLETPETWETTISEQGNTAEAWRSVLPRLGMFAKIRNVRNMLDAGLSGSEVFGDESMDHVRRSKVYPFRFYQALKALREAGIHDADAERWLSDAIDVAAETLPDDLRDTFVAVDLSGSMDSVLSERSSMTYKEIGALFGAMLMSKDAAVGGFGDHFQLVPGRADATVMERMDDVLSIDRQVGNSTNGWKAIDWLTQNNVAPDRIVVFTDMQIWDSSGGMSSRRRDNNSVRESFNHYQSSVEGGPQTHLYMIDLNSYGDLTHPEGAQNVHNINGWNDSVLDYIQYAEDPEKVVDVIEASARVQ